jgi:hypothetical protein
MAHHHQATALALVLAVSIGADAYAWQTATDTSPLDLRRNEANAARVARTLPEGAIRVTFEPAPWPSVKFTPPAGQTWDWKAYGYLLLELNNPDRHAIDLGVRIDDDPKADGKVHCRTARGEIKPGEAATFAVAIGKGEPMAHGMRGLPSYSGARTLAASGQGPFNPGHVVAFQVFLHEPSGPRTLEIRSARLAPPVSLRGIVDPLGQYAGASWPGKVQSESDLVRLHEAEAADLKAHPEPPDRNSFGGWRDGPRQAATGFFRTARVDGKWWLVDPDGALFVSLGIDVVTPNEATIITGRESMFTGLPRDGEPLTRHSGTVRQVHSGPVRSGSTFNFYAANLERTYGPDYLKTWRETTLARLKSWGFNTIGNWSDHGLYRNGKVPYVATVTIFGNHARVGSGSDYWGKMHDPFDPAFAASVERSLRGVVPLVKGDPWCLGYFVDNELSWGGFGDEGGRRGLAIGALGLPAATSPGKRALMDQLKKQYGDVAKLNAAWRTSFRDWAALDAPWKPEASASEWTAAFKADLAAFVKELARAYFKTIRDKLKAEDPDHLYLGCRFAWRTEEAVAAAAETCDVVSFNIYDRRVDPEKWAFLSTLGRPAIIGEFHAGALDRGMFHTGLVASASQEERAAIYTGYVRSVLDNPALVGCHWFQYVDEPLTGRSYDGENYNIGFLTVTDTPYPELVAAARAIHREAYTRRAGKSPGQGPIP